MSMTCRDMRRWAMKTAAPTESGILFVAVSYTIQIETFAVAGKSVERSSGISPPPLGDWHAHKMAFADIPGANRDVID